MFAALTTSMKRSCGLPVDKKIVDSGSFGSGEGGVLGLAVNKARDVVCGDSLDEIECLLAADNELSHVADIEESGGCAYGSVFSGNAGVLDGHGPPAEGRSALLPSVCGCRTRLSAFRSRVYCTEIFRTI